MFIINYLKFRQKFMNFKSVNTTRLLGSKSNDELLVPLNKISLSNIRLNNN